MTIDWGLLRAALQGNLVLPGAPTYDLLRQPLTSASTGIRPPSPDACLTRTWWPACDSRRPRTCR